VMCWLNERSSPVVFLHFICFVGCLFFVLLPSFSSSPFRSVGGCKYIALTKFFLVKKSVH